MCICIYIYSIMDYIWDIGIYRVYNGDIRDHKGIYTYRMFVVTCGYFWDS